MIRERLKLYKLRFKVWNLKTGTVEWHEAVAKLRAYEGDGLSASAHRLIASLKRLARDFLTTMAETIESIGQSLNEMKAALNEAKRAQ